jgi:hygromycin-B 7''-O-kinase
MALPPDLSAAEFDALHDEPAAWRADIEALARSLGSATLEPVEEGTALVSRVEGGRILKVYPPFLHDHYAFERVMLDRLHGRLALPTPQRLADGLYQGWPWVLMSELPGTPLSAAWPGLGQAQRRAALRDLGALAAQVHALPVGEMAALAPAWPDFIAVQRERCAQRQRRVKLPPHLLAQLDAFLAGPLPEGPPVLLTGEYTPFNLMSDGRGRLSAMFDFGDGLVGPREYDWLGPLCFLAAGDAGHIDAFFEGYGAEADAAMRLKLLRLLLLHRYSAPPAQIKCPGWQQEPDFEAVARRIWPL